MLRIRLRRVGKKKQPSYRIVVADSRSPRDGAFVERIGHYDPLIDPPAVTLNKERALEWLSRGAQPSDAVQRIFKWQRLFEDEAPEGEETPVMEATETEALGGGRRSRRRDCRVMQELIEYIAKNLASKPDEVKVTSVIEDDRIILRLEVAQEDKGKIIGRQGRVAQAMRTILRVAAIKEGSRAVLEIV